MASLRASLSNDFLFACTSFNNNILSISPNNNELSKILDRRVPDNETYTKVINFVINFYFENGNIKDIPLEWLFTTKLLSELLSGLSDLPFKTITLISQFIIAIHPFLSIEQKITVLKDYKLCKKCWNLVIKFSSPSPVFTELVVVYTQVDNYPAELAPFITEFASRIIKLLNKRSVVFFAPEAAALVFGYSFLQMLFHNKSNYTPDTLKLCEDVCRATMPLFEPVSAGVAKFKKKLVFQNADLLVGAMQFLETIFVDSPRITAVLNSDLHVSSVLIRFVVSYNNDDKYVFYEASKLFNVYLSNEYHKKVYDFNYEGAITFALNCLKLGSQELENKYFDGSLVLMFISNYLLLVSSKNPDFDADTLALISTVIERYIDHGRDKMTAQNVKEVFEFVDLLKKQPRFSMSLQLMKKCSLLLLQFDDHDLHQCAVDYFLASNIVSDAGYELVVSGCFDVFIVESFASLSEELDELTKDSELRKSTLKDSQLVEAIVHCCTSRGKLSVLDSVLKRIQDSRVVETIISKLGLISNQAHLDVLLKLLMELPVDGTMSETHITEVFILGNLKIKHKVLNIIFAALQTSRSSDFLLHQQDLLREVFGTSSWLEDAQYKQLLYQLLDKLLQYMSDASKPEFLQFFQECDIIGFVIMAGLDDPENVKCSLGMLKSLVYNPQCYFYIQRSAVLRKVITSFNENRWYSGPIFTIFYRFHIKPDGNFNPEATKYLFSIDFFSMIPTFYDMIRQVVLDQSTMSQGLKILEKPVLKFFMIMRAMVWCDPECKKMLAYERNTEFNYLCFVLLHYSDVGEYSVNTVSTVLDLHMQVVGDKPVLIGENLVDMKSVRS